MIMLFHEAISSLEKNGYKVINNTFPRYGLLTNDIVKVLVDKNECGSITGINCYKDNLCIATTEDYSSILSAGVENLSIDEIIKILCDDPNKIIPRFNQLKIMQDLDQLAG